MELWCVEVVCGGVWVLWFSLSNVLINTSSLLLVEFHMLLRLCRELKKRSWGHLLAAVALMRGDGAAAQRWRWTCCLSPEHQFPSHFLTIAHKVFLLALTGYCSCSTTGPSHRPTPCLNRWKSAVAQLKKVQKPVEQPASPLYFCLFILFNTHEYTRLQKEKGKSSSSAIFLCKTQGILYKLYH